MAIVAMLLIRIGLLNHECYTESLSLPRRCSVWLSWYHFGQNHPGFARGVNAKRKRREGGLLISGTDMPVHVAKCAFIYTHIHIHTFIIYVWVCFILCSYANIPTYLPNSLPYPPAYIHASINIYTHTYTHTHIHLFHICIPRYM